MEQLSLIAVLFLGLLLLLNKTITKSRIMENKEFIVTNYLYATKSQRFCNYVVDFIIQYVIALGFGFLIGMVASLTGMYGFSSWVQEMSKPEQYLLGSIITIIYYGLSETFLSRSLGKYITNTIVVMADGSKPTLAIIIIRSFCRIIPFLDAFSFLNSSSRGWHDSFSNTYVVRKEAFEQSRELFYSFNEMGKTEDQIIAEEKNQE